MLSFPQHLIRREEVICSYFRQFGSAPKWGSNRFLRSLYWACRGFQYWLCFYDDDIEVDVEDLLSNPFITQPPSLEQLQAVTGFQKEWIMFIYRNFKQHDKWLRYVSISAIRENPLVPQDLIMCLYELTQYSDLPADTPSSSSASYSSNTVEFVFRLMKPDHNGAVSLQAFTEYVQCVFNLNSTTSSNVSNAHAISQMHTSSQQLSPSDETRAKISPGIRNYALQQFKVSIPLVSH
ncbi:unnamed protein product [Anisakis simplex]|uniref:EF-hand_13 domain-containing protein n=1 Tax=Anisakis simplex TaxID=6269 RepID=A0A0M3K7S3_ANISI|nr:unnamed protein product [Anisakis simplex]